MVPPLRRFRPQFTVHEVVVKGPPWNTRVCTRGEVRMELATGGVYVNQWCQFVHLSWGRIQEDRIYLDTQLVAALDAMLTPAANG